jgi:hypothetical protein
MQQAAGPCRLAIASAGSGVCVADVGQTGFKAGRFLDFDFERQAGRSLFC